MWPFTKPQGDVISGAFQDTAKHQYYARIHTVDFSFPA
jgi:hypothetical protein